MKVKYTGIYARENLLIVTINNLKRKYSYMPLLFHPLISELNKLKFTFKNHAVVKKVNSKLQFQVKSSDTVDVERRLKV